MNRFDRWNPFLPISLERRRRRLLFGIAFFSIIFVAFLFVALMGLNRHITLIMSLAISPTLIIFIVQWARVCAKISKHGPDQLEECAPASGRFVKIAIAALIVVVAIGEILVLGITR